MANCAPRHRRRKEEEKVGKTKKTMSSWFVTFRCSPVLSPVLQSSIHYSRAVTQDTAAPVGLLPFPTRGGFSPVRWRPGGASGRSSRANTPPKQPDSKQ
eukprot:g81531.t1